VLYSKPLKKLRKQFLGLPFYQRVGFIGEKNENHNQAISTFNRHKSRMGFYGRNLRLEK
jgi:hypothetical protein